VDRRRREREVAPRPRTSTFCIRRCTAGPSHRRRIPHQSQNPSRRPHLRFLDHLRCQCQRLQRGGGESHTRTGVRIDDGDAVPGGCTLEVPLLGTVVTGASEAGQVEEKGNFASGSLRREIEIQGHGAFGGRGIMFELEQAAAEAGYLCCGFESHCPRYWQVRRSGCRYQARPVDGANAMGSLLDTTSVWCPSSPRLSREPSPTPHMHSKHATLTILTGSKRIGRRTDKLVDDSRTKKTVFGLQ